MKNFFYLLLAILVSCSSPQNENREGKTGSVLLKNAKILRGDSTPVIENGNILIENGRIAEVGAGVTGQGAEEVDLSGKTVMPAIMCTHAHIGVVKDTTASGANYTRENIIRQLKKYASYGVLHVQALGTDRPLLFQNGLYDSLRNGSGEGARLISAGFGFNVPQANVNPSSTQGLVYRPSSASQVPAEMDSLAKLGINTVKIWVDDFNKTVPKMNEEVYHAIIDEAHKRNMKVAAHVYYLADARRLVADGIDFLAHSIRDSVVDDALLAMMKSKDVVYIPTLSLDKFAYAYGGETEWINDPFFKESLEPGVYEMISSEKYKNDTKNSPAYARNQNAFKIAMANAKKIFDYGIKVALGTDSGAFPIRTQGFAEHLEMQLLSEAGVPVSDVIAIATNNSAQALGLRDFGTIGAGKVADLLVLDADPMQDIKNTRKIFSVYKAGVKVK
ncbi:MAG: amidohydrolase family protein [Chitinophagaceae bacterium]|nr:amidohydrolase family protein [Chitinophagaceae bacterium]